jgi:ornithine cyclodeaminase/alanine dehydrogenase-like protein (mu-crystallin family)
MNPLRHLSAAEVTAALPPLSERVDLACRTMTAIGHEAELPSKIGVHPRWPGSLADAMPALLRADGDDPTGDLLGVKWIVGMPDNPSRGLPTYSALVILNDPVNGMPLAVMDGGAITTARTAAISGAVIAHFLGGGARMAAPDVAVLGAGAQGLGHAAMIGCVLPGARLRIVDAVPARAAAVAGEAAAFDGIASTEAVANVRDAVEGAALVVTAVSFGANRQGLDPALLAPDALVVSVDYDIMAGAALAAGSLFLVDEPGQFLARRKAGLFAGFRDPDGTIGGALRGELPAATAPRDGGLGRILALHLGVGLADVVLGAAVLARAETLGLGRMLPR